ncbi:MAG TPA: Rrf2 family transcriptional regulator [Mucilaginibacter sp.]|nr:Rrf2 family transcriptional regulator [Mucilaginibacter sp.]
MFSKATEYALRATIYIAQKSAENKRTGLAEISQAIGSPQSFTAKVLQQLTKNGIIDSISGPNGGFYLSEKSRQMPIRSVLTAMKEDEVLVKCIVGLAECSETKPCAMHAQYKLIKSQLIQLFENMSIETLANKPGTNVI